MPEKKNKLNLIQKEIDRYLSEESSMSSSGRSSRIARQETLTQIIGIMNNYGGEVCGCGRAVRYMGPKGKLGSCNKYMRCLSYEEQRDFITKLQSEARESQQDISTLKTALKLLN